MDDFMADRPAYGSLSAKPLPAAAPARSGSRWPWILVLASTMFALGLLINPWFESNVRDRLFGNDPARVTDSAALLKAQARDIAVLKSRLTALEQVPVRGGGDPARIVRAEAQVNELQSRVGALGVRVDGAVTEVAQDAQTAQSVMLVAAARRVIDTGQALGSLEPPLRASFGQSYPGPVEALVAAGSRPMTLTRLQQNFERVADSLAVQPAAANSWWATFMSTVAEIASIRRSDTKQVDPEVVAAEASQRLDSGDVAGAIAILSRLPATGALSTWLADARRYRAAQAALAQIEAAALATSVALPTVATP